MELDIEFDRIAFLVEAKLGQAITLDGLVIKLTLSESRSFIDRTTGTVLGVGALTYLADYNTVAADPTTAAH